MKYNLSETEKAALAEYYDLADMDLLDVNYEILVETFAGSMLVLKMRLQHLIDTTIEGIHRIIRKHKEG